MFTEWPPLEDMARPWWEGAYCTFPVPESWCPVGLTVCPNLRGAATHDRDPWDDVALEAVGM